MERAQAFVENFIGNWNGEFPVYPLTAGDLKKPHALMGALLLVFDRLGIDKEAVLAPPPEESRTDHTAYYWDLLPVINVTRIINHLVAVMPQVEATLCVTHFLQPTATTSHSILLLLFNLMVFNEQRLRDIAPCEEELFSKTDQVKTLEDRRNQLLQMLNDQAEEKGKRAQRLEKLDIDIKQLEEELRQEKEAHEEDRQELDLILKENHQIDLQLEQKKIQRDTIVADVERKRALRVYDADEIRAQAEQMARNVQEAEEKLNTLRATLMEKENSLKNLQNIKPSLDTANNLLLDIQNLQEEMMDLESGDLDSEGKEGELYMLNMELSELEANLAELRAARAEADQRAHDSHAKRQQDKISVESALREAEDKDKKCRKQTEQNIQKISEIKNITIQCEEYKAQGIAELDRIKETFSNELKKVDEVLIKKTLEVKNCIEEKIKNRN